MVSRGPVTAACEQLAACCVVDCPDADSAIQVATSIPAAWYGSVEVRPVVTEPVQPGNGGARVPGEARLAVAASASLS
jgi:hypothetical protein